MSISLFNIEAIAWVPDGAIVCTAWLCVDERRYPIGSIQVTEDGIYAGCCPPLTKPIIFTKDVEEAKRAVEQRYDSMQRQKAKQMEIYGT